jgi:hypothetical protein
MRAQRELKELKANMKMLDVPEALVAPSQTARDDDDVDVPNSRRYSNPSQADRFAADFQNDFFPRIFKRPTIGAH